MGKKIIVIDDSQTIREQVATTLRKAGFEILEAVDGVDGAEVIERTPDAALVNLRREHAEARTDSSCSRASRRAGGRTPCPSSC